MYCGTIPAVCQPPNKQLERTVTRRRVRAASAPFHYALAARWTAQRAAAQLRRYTARIHYARSTCPFVPVLLLVVGGARCDM